MYIYIYPRTVDLFSSDVLHNKHCDRTRDAFNLASVPHGKNYIYYVQEKHFLSQ